MGAGETLHRHLGEVGFKYSYDSNSNMVNGAFISRSASHLSDDCHPNIANVFVTNKIECFLKPRQKL